jgi:signal transduction histidine kinase
MPPFNKILIKISIKKNLLDLLNLQETFTLADLADQTDIDILYS